MFHTDAFFKRYPCPKNRQSSRCRRPYCQFNHILDNSNENDDENNFLSMATVLSEDSSVSLGIEDFFSNLKPEDIDDFGSVNTSYISADDIYDPTSSDISDFQSSDVLFKSNQLINKKQVSTKQSIDASRISSNANTVSVSSSAVTATNSSSKGVLGAKNKRIAHVASYDVSTVLNNSKKIKIKKTPKQIMLERYAKIKANSLDTNHNFDKAHTRVHSIEQQKTLPKPIVRSASINCGTDKIDYTITEALKPAPLNVIKPVLPVKQIFQPCTMDRNDKRVAHQPQLVDQQKNLNVLLIPHSIGNTKIPLRTRTSNVKKIFDEIIKNNSSKSSKTILIEQARDLEKEICKRSKSIVNIYLSLSASKIRSIRNGELERLLNNDSGTVQTTKIETSLSKNFSIVTRTKLTYKDFGHDRIVKSLEQMIIPEEKLFDYGYPILIEATGLPKFPCDQQSKKPLVHYAEGLPIVCVRCQKTYMNPQIPKEDACVYHPRHAYNRRAQGMIDRSYVCCRGDPDSVGCCSSRYHVTNGYQFIESRTGFVRTFSMPQKAPAMFALDCEMCYTEIGFEICRLTVLNFDGDVIYETFIKPPNPIIDYNTQYSGLKAEDFLDVTTSLNDVQLKLLELISSESFIIGHGLDSDFRVLKLYHDRIIDTAHLFPHKRGLPFKRSLKNLASEFLKKIIQQDECGHDSKEDALASLELVKFRLQDELSKYNIS